MASRSTRNKLRFQVAAAQEDLQKAQTHLVQAAALADGRSPDVEAYVPDITASLELLKETLTKLYERL